MLVLALLSAALAIGGSSCRKRVRYTVVVPNTAEGAECRRQCMVVYEACVGGRGKNERACRPREDVCLQTCPGAYTATEDGAPVTVPAG